MDRRRVTSANRPERGPSPRPRGRPSGQFTQHRKLALLRQLLLGSTRGLTQRELAQALGVTVRSVRRYLREVERDLPLESQSRGGGRRAFRVRPGEAPRMVRVRRTQAFALLAARRLFDTLRGSTLHSEIDFAVQELLAVARRPGRGPNAGVADARLEERFLYLPHAPKDYSTKTEELDDLYQAVADLKPLACLYRSGPGGQEAAVVLHPYAMVLYKDAIYCVGRHVAKDRVSTFLLDRMRSTELRHNERFTLPDDFRIEDYFQGQFGIFRGAERHRVVVEFAPRVADYVLSRKVHPSQRLEARPDGGVRLEVTLGDLNEIASWVLSFGETAKVVAPKVLVERVQGELARAAAQYRRPAAQGRARRATRREPGA